MTTNVQISGRLMTAARGLTGVSLADFAAAADLPVRTVSLIEEGGSAFVQSDQHVAALSRALEYFGVVVIAESDGMGAGVRLRFTRQDVRQIARLEDEGGVIGADDAP